MSLFSEVRDYKLDRIQAQKKQPKNFHVVSKKDLMPFNTERGNWWFLRQEEKVAA